MSYYDGETKIALVLRYEETTYDTVDKLCEEKQLISMHMSKEIKLR